MRVRSNLAASGMVRNQRLYAGRRTAALGTMAMAKVLVPVVLFSACDSSQRLTQSEASHALQGFRANADCAERFEVSHEDPSLGLLIDGLPGRPTCLVQDRQGAIWIGLEYRGVARYSNGELRLFDAYNAHLPDQGIQDILVDQQDVKWFATTRGYLLSYDDRRPHRQRWRHHMIDGIEEPLQRHLAEGQRFRRLRQHPNGTIWVLLNSGGMMCMQGERLRRHPIDELDGIEAYSMDIDAGGRFWIATRRGVFYGRGTTWQTLSKDDYGKDISRVPSVWDIYCCNDIVYFATNHGLVRNRSGSSELWTAGTSGLLHDRVTTVRGNGDEQFVLGYGSTGDGISVFNGKKWFHFQGDPVRERLYLMDAIVPRPGKFLVVSRRGSLFSCNDGGLARKLWPRTKYPGKSFRTLPWRQRALKDLVRQPVVNASMDDLLQHPHQFYNKKIRIVGNIATRFEYAALVSADGSKLGTCPDWHDQLSAFLRQSGWGDKLKGQPVKEYYGYLEYGGYFGHAGATPRQFFIVEVYPHGDEAGQANLRKTDLRKDLLAWLADHLHVSRVFPEPQTERRISDRRRLQGKWDVVGGDSSTTTSLIVQWDRVTREIGGRRYGYVMRIDPDRPIPAIDLYSTDDSALSLFGIYELQGDQLKIHLTNLFRRHPRPSDWRAPRDSEPVLLALRRDPSFEAPGSRAAFPPDPRDWHDKLRAEGTVMGRDAFGRVNSIYFNAVQGSAPVCDDDLLALENLRNLETLRFRLPGVTDRGLETIGKITTLRYLELGRGSDIRGYGLKHLRGLKSLRTLAIDGDKLNVAGLEQLKQFQHLHQLYVRGLSMELKEELQASLPKVRVN